MAINAARRHIAAGCVDFPCAGAKRLAQLHDAAVPHADVAGKCIACSDGSGVADYKIIVKHGVDSSQKN